MELQQDNRAYNKANFKTNVNSLNQYQKSLLMPRAQLPAKIPGTWGRRSIIVHRYSTNTYTTNAAGHFCLLNSPNEIIDSAAVNSTTYATTAASLYDPATPLAVVAITAENTKPYYNITTGTVRGCRVVSLSIRAYSLSTALNRTGTIYGCLWHNSGYAPKAFGASTSSMPGVPSIQNHIMDRANVGNSEGIQVCYVPSDDDDLAFLDINTGYNIRHANGDDAYYLVIIAQGMQASSQIKVEIDVNFELIPISESSLAGLETPAPANDAIPALLVGHLKTHHVADIAKVITAYDQGSGYMNEPLKTMNKQPQTQNNQHVHEKPIYVVKAKNPKTKQKLVGNNLVDKLVDYAGSKVFRPSKVIKALPESISKKFNDIKSFIGGK